VHVDRPRYVRGVCKECFRLSRRYGLDPSRVQELMRQGACAICGDPFDGARQKLHVDHCHKTGRVRGALCAMCNHGLGSFRDRKDLLLKAIRYIR
jgi:hypothetical protein